MPHSIRSSGRPTSLPVEAGLLAAVFVSLLWLERRSPLRPEAPHERRRRITNAAVGATGAVVAAALLAPVTERAARIVERRRLGVVPRLGLPPIAERAVALLLLDHGLYHWHALLHRVPALWRWHLVHHADRELDVSTALRFHAVEMLWSVPWHAAHVLWIGVQPATLRLWAALASAEILFHHANLKLPPQLERWLGRIVVTPRQHTIHHSNVAAHQRSNLSSGLSLWDSVHGTSRRDLDAGAIAIGLPGDVPRATPNDEARR
jgi:sterol desaturase/sphingolipid hydroxylase (fatty acid hydroxylase superfamily)